ncbi:MAG: phosphatidylglycerophosphatase A [Phycisphaerae bacterium]
MNGARGQTWRLLCVTGLGSGFIKITPATWGSLVASALFWVAARGGRAGGVGPVVVEVVLLLGIVAATALSVLLGDWAIQRFGRKDPKPFVLDEFAGQWVSLLGAATLTAPGAVFTAHVGCQFVLFRIFDVLKPPPARQLERLPAGWGIVADDLVAGLFANVAGLLLYRYSGLREWIAAWLNGLGLGI